MRKKGAEQRGVERNDVATEFIRIQSLQRDGDVNGLIAELANAAEDPPIVLRSAAARALGQLRDARATQPLLKLLHDDDQGVRATAAQALGQIGDDAAAPELRRSAREDTSPVVRSWAAHSLGSVRDPEAIPVLIDSLGDSDFRVRRGAAVALANIGDERAVSALKTARAAEPWWRRRALTKAYRTIVARQTRRP